ncbi:GTP 3',8-cyclase MoaA [Oleiagrimonas soli]|uniref:GTP 3',8-cyclase n=1 Tax=Oleiagrimonas soli TaxID=1543381 RepID=A0A099D173_9GAMM|nr:GTP 3',8-cyclase MoaA [Oleiagrimonas soli]KGI79010.1 molybdenum cofactor biosynthesis protein A [Oleiagrimonas soli]MBB6184640.1 cyclic pyranopterin phosphate synthase [Oleiagrimonas soli]
MHPLADTYGRRFPYLRLSVIPACNFRCTYCLPHGYRADPNAAGPLSLDEIARLLRGFTRLGMRKLRITGGEPSLRRDLTDILRTAASVPGVERLAMTTNGSLLTKRLDAWADAGLNAINVSVDTLDATAFAALTGHDRLSDILEGVDRAVERGLTVKLNAVLLRGVNDDQLPAWLDYLRTHRVGVRFIELMQTGDNLDYFRRHHVRAELLEQRLRDAGWTALPRAADAGPAREYLHPDYAGRVGIIAPYSKDFCAGCNRLRVTATGDLRLCLFGEFGIPLRALLQRDEQIDDLVRAIGGQIGRKEKGHFLHEGRTGITPHLASTGG